MIVDNDDELPNIQFEDVGLLLDDGESSTDLFTSESRFVGQLTGLTANYRLRMEYHFAWERGKVELPQFAEVVSATPFDFDVDAAKYLDGLRETGGGVAVNYRFVVTNVEGDDLFLGNWNVFEYTVVPNPQTGPFRFENVELLFDTENQSTLHATEAKITQSRNPTVIGWVAGEISDGTNFVDFSHDGGATVLFSQSVSANDESVIYDPRNSDPSFEFQGVTKSIYYRTRNISPTQLEIVSEWREFEFRIVEPSPQLLAVTQVALEFDSGDSGDPKIVGRVDGESSFDGTIDVEVDWLQNGSVDQVIAVDRDREWELPILSSSDQMQYVNLRAVEWDFATGVKYPGAWRSFSFILDSDSPPEILELDLLNDTGVSGDRFTWDPTIVGGIRIDEDDVLPWIELDIDGEFDNDRVTSVPVISGEVSQATSETYVDIDLDQDGEPDSTVRLSEQTSGSASFAFARPMSGQTEATTSFRTRYWDDYSKTKVFSDWVDFSFTYEYQASHDAGDLNVTLGKDDGPDPIDRVTSDPTFRIEIEASQTDFSRVEAEIVGVARSFETIPLNGERTVLYAFNELTPNSYVLRTRTIGVNSATSERIVGDWHSFDFELIDVTVHRNRCRRGG